VSDPIWLGLDLGTQSVCALAVSASGAILADASRPLTSRRDGPRHGLPRALPG
jgi:ribulose kinase